MEMCLLSILGCILVTGLVNAGQGYMCPPRHLDSATYDKLHGKTCYEFVVYLKRDFDDAQSYCKGLGGRLAIVKSEEVNKFIGDTLEEAFDIQYTPVWIGLQYFGKEEMYKWVDGSQIGEYTNFMESVTRYGENCVAMIPKTRQWVDFHCDSPLSKLQVSNKKMFVCEYPPMRVSSVTTRPHITVEDCPEILARDKYLKVFRNKCYMFEMDSLKNFNDAEEHCRRGKGVLVVINNQMENKFIQKELYSISGVHGLNSWIGLRLDFPSKRFQWLDGSLISYSEISHQTFRVSPDVCVTLDEIDGSWLVESCTKNRHPFVCEFLPVAHNHE